MSSRRPASAPLAAFVLHRYDWSESSLILDLFTRDQGRVVAVAKGAKRPNSQLRPVLLPLQRVQVTLGRAPVADDDSEIYNLRGAEYGGGAPMPGGAALFAGLYLNELLMKLLPRSDPHIAVFDAYAQTLPALGASEDPATLCALRAFELTLLRDIGWLPDLSLETATQQALSPQRSYVLQAEHGLVPSANGQGGLPGLVWVDLQAALVHGSVAALRMACRAQLSPLRAQLRGVLHYHLGTSHLRTRQVMLDVQKLIELS